MTTRIFHPLLELLLLLAAFPLLTNAYSFEFTSKPKQCQDLSLKITGTGGNPPYQLVLVPAGPSPLPGGVEPRIVTVKDFPNNNDTLTFKLAYPGNSKFVAVVSDASGFGSGGTSAETVVETSSDNSCYDSSKSADAAYIFNISPPTSLIQCQPTRIWWDKTQTRGDAQFQGVIPAGESFTIPVGQLSDVQYQGYGFNWTVNARASTPIFIIAGDERGLGSAGCADFTISSGTEPNNSCINDNSPSVTPGQPAGAVRPTDSPNDQPQPNRSNSTAPIVGGVVGGVGGVVVIVFIGVFFFRRRKQRQRQPKKVNLLFGDRDEDEGGRTDHVPQHFEVQPFIVPPNGGSHHTTTNRPPSVMSSSEGHGGGFYYSDPNTNTGGTTSGTGRKSNAGPQFRPTNIIQHEDAGPSRVNLDLEPVETIELPPAYSNLRR